MNNLDYQLDRIPSIMSNNAIDKAKNKKNAKTETKHILKLGLSSFNIRHIKQILF